MRVIEKFKLETVNRGEREYIISVSKKGYFAHELGDLTQWAKAFGTEEQKAHRINPTKRYGNQYGTFLGVQPFLTIHSARIATQIEATVPILCR